MLLVPQLGRERDHALLPDLARHLASQPTVGLGAIKRALLASATNTLDTQLDVECDLQRELGRTEDYAEGVAAWMEKRPPQFRSLSD